MCIRFPFQAVRRPPGFPFVDPFGAIQDVFVVQAADLAGQFIQLLRVAADPSGQLGKGGSGIAFQEDPVDAPADGLLVDVQASSGGVPGHEPVKDRHQRAELDLGGHVMPVCEPEGKVPLYASVRHDDRDPAEEISSAPDFRIDLIDQEIRQIVHAGPAADDGLPVEIHFLLIVRHIERTIHSFKNHNRNITGTGGISSGKSFFFRFFVEKTNARAAVRTHRQKLFMKSPEKGPAHWKRP